MKDDINKNNIPIELIVDLMRAQKMCEQVDRLLEMEWAKEELKSLGVKL